METDDVTALLQRVGREVVEPRFRRLAGGEVASKGLAGPVTVADREAESLLTEALLAAHPGALVLGEEAAAADPSLVRRLPHAAHAFTVDPVDGTRAFVRGSPDHAMLLAELRAGEVVRSWIWQPQHRRSYVAERGAGAWRDGVRLGPRPVPDHVAAVAGRGRLGRAVGVLTALRRTGSCCGVDYPRLAEGEADYAVYAKTKPWDHLPGSLLLAETGGLAAGPDGVPHDARHRAPRVLVAAADPTTSRLVRTVVGRVPGLSSQVREPRPATRVSPDHQ